MNDARYNFLSAMAKKFVTNEKNELGDFDLIKEINLEQARKLGGHSGNLITNLGLYTDPRTSPEKKVAALEAVKSSYAEVVNFARRYKACFEARKVLLMCEAKMISAKINPAKLNEEISKAESEAKSSGENSEG